ncbi:response regulator transcription factor [Paenibacillus filicis]|uniref:Response regulator transcription factor n=1 Tax=Paenibacillus filicis TaxID=669464 RepID=A0ABU9DSQ5_9BACL
MYKILVIEDSETIRLELGELLSRYGYIVEAPNSFNNIMEYVNSKNPDLILLDINLPFFDGYYICREIRKKSQVPIIIVTSRDSEADELMSMNLGADDFITKPYHTQILLARIFSVLRRAYDQGKDADVISYRGLQLNLANGSIRFEEKTLELTKNELKVLAYLIKNKGSIVTREELMEYLWSADYFADDNSLSVNITRLRKKLNEIGTGEMIETRRGLGYIVE